MTNIYDDKKIGGRIKQARKERKLSQDAVGQSCNRSRQLVSNWEKGDLSSLSIGDLTALSNLFECDMGFLLGEHETKRRVVADIQEKINLSERAIIALIDMKQRQIPTEVLSSILVQPLVSQWLDQIYRIACEKEVCSQLEKMEKAEKATMDNPRLTALARSAIDHVAIHELEIAELQESNHRHIVLPGAVNTLRDTSKAIQEYGKNGVKNSIAKFRVKYGLEEKENG